MTSQGVQWSGDTESKPAPGALRRVQALINTIDLESGQDRLAAPVDARPWLVDNGLLAPDADPRADELLLIAGVREALRALVIHNSGGPAPDPAMSARLRELAEGNPVRVVVGVDGSIALSAGEDSIRSRLLALLLVVKDAQLDGTWTHMKACANDDCAWVFYDRSRNHGGTWCDMATCGNKLKNRDFRARRRQPDLGRQVPHQRRRQRAEPVERPVQRDRRDQAAAAPAQPREHETRCPGGDHCHHHARNHSDQADAEHLGEADVAAGQAE
jgi:predicted RNA-binding Zn ribbon-like protein